jgi:hypothetical protein
MIFICNYLYLNGGVFISEDILLKNNINDILKESESLYLHHENIITFLCVPKNEEFLLTYINNLINNININDIFIFFDKKFKILNSSFYQQCNKKMDDNNKVIKKNKSQLFFNLNNYKFWIYNKNEDDSILNSKFNIEYLNLNYFLFKIESSTNDDYKFNNDSIKIKYLNESNDETNVITINYNNLNNGSFIFKI